MPLLASILCLGHKETEPSINQKFNRRGVVNFTNVYIVQEIPLYLIAPKD
jgi:hypothetical protein